MPIHSQVDSARQLTIYTAEGVVSFEEIMSTSKEFYVEDPTLKVIWDFSKNTGSGVSSSQIEKLAAFVCKMDQKTKIVEKLATVTPRDLDYGLGRMFEVFLEFNKYQPEHRIFRRFEDAIAWVEGKKGEVRQLKH